jgi:D-glycero-alpha-D-manno-heptose-7-phosphate kinase
MIISRTPLRVTLAGGGTDLPEFYSRFGGSVVSMAIDKYIYIHFKRNILDNFVRLRYLQNEEVTNSNKLSNERARCVLQKFKIYNKCEIISVGDLPSNTGLGSSGSYLVGLINAIQKYSNLNMSKQEIAELACDLEINTLGEPVGKQDQYIASYGHVYKFDIDTSGNVFPSKVNISNIDELIENTRIYYTGIQRSASEILHDQKKDHQKFNSNLQKIQDIGLKMLDTLINNNFDDYGLLLNDYWRYKKSLSASVSNNVVESIYDDLIERKLILGGKIIGAGGGGFLLVYAPKNRHKFLDQQMEDIGYPRLDYGIDIYGTSIVYEQ